MNSILVMWSGGLDSTYCVWKALQSESSVHLHHINFINSDMRFQSEKQAIKNMKRWLRQEGYQFEYSESTIDMSDVFNFGFDEDWVLFIAGKVALDIIGDVIIYEGSVIEDQSGELLQLRHKVRGSMVDFFNTCAWYHPDKTLKLKFPAKNKTKQEIWNKLPDMLRHLTFSCRRPYQGQPCGKCKSCKQIGGIIDN